MNFIKQYTSDAPELSSLIAQKQRAEDSDANLDFTGTMQPFSGQDLPTEGDIERYLSSVSDDKPKKDTSAKDRRDRRQNQKRFKDAATKALREDAIGGGSFKVFKDAYDSGASSERLQSIAKEDKKIKEKLKDMEKGIITGFAKGGLASRTK